MEEASFFETLVPIYRNISTIYQSIWHYILNDSDLII
jgi:hypothetical protein